MREPRAIMAELAATGLTGDQMALLMELTAAVALEARPIADEAAERRRERDREYQAERRRQNRQMSADSSDAGDAPPPPDKNPPHPQKLTPPASTHTHTRARGDRVFACPEGVDAQHWADFLANRRSKRLARTETAYRAQLKALADLSDDEWPPGRIVEFAAARGWGAIFDPRGRDDGKRNGSRPNGMAGNRGDSPSVLDAAELAMQDFGYHRH